MSAGKFTTFAAAAAGAAGLATFNSSNETPGTDPNELTPHVHRLTEAEMNEYKLIEIDSASLQLPTNEPRIITVKFGDRLETIAENLIRDGYQFRSQIKSQNQGKTYHETVTGVVREICAANQITDPNIVFANQELEIPFLLAPVPSFYSYEVKSGDTLSAISRSFRSQGIDISPAAIAQFNGITLDSLIYPGQALRIPAQMATLHAVDSDTPPASGNPVGLLSSQLDTIELRESFIEMVKQHEGLRLQAYVCVGGKCTIGYGHTSSVEPGTRISRADADRFLAADLERAGRLVAQHVSVPLSQPQYEALVDMAFNLGPQLFIQKNEETGNWEDTHTKRAINSLNVHSLIDSNDHHSAVRQYKNWCAEVTDRMDDWINAGGVPQGGLIKRRADDVALFNQDYAVWRKSVEQQETTH